MTTEFELRQWQWGDEQSLVKHANNINIWNNVRNYFPHPYTIQHAYEWVNMVKDDPLNFAIIVNDEAVGGISLVQQEDIYAKNAEIGYWLGEEFWGQGIITEAIKKVAEIGFNTTDIHRIYAGIFDYNLASQRVLEKAGFHHEATLKKSIFKNGEFWDELVFVMRKSQFLIEDDNYKYNL